MKKRITAKPSVPAAKRTKPPAKIIGVTSESVAAAMGVFHGDQSVGERHAAGRDLRAKVPREAHGGWTRPTDIPSGVEIVLAGNKGRQQDR